jgi:hypothetical protein
MLNFAGFDRIAASVFVKSALVTGFGTTALIGPLIDSLLIAC